MIFALGLLFAGLQVPPPPAPVDQTAEQDHRRTLDLLGIASLRRGADGRNPKAPNAANYDEAKANPFPELPDPLVLKSGKRVTTAAQWWTERRPEIVEAFDREVYGRAPRSTPPVEWQVVTTDNEVVGSVPAVTKTLRGRVDNAFHPAVAVDIELTLTTPSAARGKVPVVLELAFNWAGRRPPGGLVPAGPTAREQVLARGWGYATLFPTSVQADDGAGLTRGIIGLVKRGRARDLDDWGALRAWAWGASRALDYFETDPSVDARRVGVEGHSRYGKAALVAMAYDDRFAVAYVSSSGAGGAKLHRRNFGEIVENVAGVGEYHWMAGQYLKYAGPLTWADLPVDAHQLIALCAPRPVFIGSGSSTAGDGWVDPRGMFLAAVGAGPVYRLLGKKDLGTSDFPPLETALVSGDLAFRQHAGGHTPGPNWPAFLDFAERYLGRPPPASRWVGTWAASPQRATAEQAPPAPGFANATLRQRVRVSLGGNRVRLRFSNAFGETPLTLDSVEMALSGEGSAIRPGTGRALTFGGRRSVTVAPGALAESDALAFALPALADVTVSLHLKGAPAQITIHPGSRTTSYFASGDVASAVDLPDAARIDHWYFLNGIDVERDDRAATVAILGDSITDGRGSTTNGNDRWPDQLARRLQADPRTAHVAVVNHGIGGNRLLRDGLGPSALSRLDRDVLAQPGVRWLVVLEGINDLGTRVEAREKGDSWATADDIIGAYQQIVARARARGLRVYGATLMPFDGFTRYFRPDTEADRQTVNAWIRTGGHFDGVIDFDAVTRDPGHPSRLGAAVDGGDHLHPSAGGYRIMADAVDLSLFMDAPRAARPGSGGP